MRTAPVVILSLCIVCNVYADEAPAARALLDRLNTAIDAVEADLPAITRAANDAARPFIDGRDIALRADLNILRQINEQPGGFMTAFIPEGDFGFTPATYADGPLAEVTRAIAAWTWSCELFAAVTREGKLPVLRLHRDLDGLRQWQRTYMRQRLHEDKNVDPIAEGVLGGQYLNELRAVLRDVGTASWRSIAKASNRSASTVLNGRTLFIRSPRRLPDPMNLFVRFDHAGEEPGMPVPGQGDFMIAIGADEGPGSFDWGQAHLFHQATRGVVWVVGAYQARPRTLWSREFVIDQRWPYGQALLKIDGYKPRLANVTGIVADAVQLMLTEQIGTIVAEQRAADRRPPMKPLEPQRIPVPLDPEGPNKEPDGFPYTLTLR